ncbi:cell division protein FtsZ [Sunxiuqinia dokdonensis]|uniref:Cell division protein FtsZ n=2 Tax=Sunxiuqinia dokdonensis TaxID=1409788 RepID=A0A0L8V332_9BACT|nr:cell division protein FtsZ [Sunxiuqinia dokdonensis]
MIIAGMGGGTGTGAAPVIARTAYEMGILTVAIVTIPFKNEGQRRIKQALEGVAEIEKYVDSLLVIDNEKLREMYGEFRISEAFSSADDILATTAKGIAETITVQDYINIDFADVEAIMRRSGVAIMGTALGVGQNRALNATKEALRSPLLNNNKLKGAQNILLNITSGDEVTMEEIGQITDYVQNSAGKDVDLIWGNGNDTSLDSKIRITIIATGFTSNYSINEKSYLDAEGIIKQQFKQDDKYLSLFFIDDEYSPNEIAEIVSLLSDLYKEIGGDELVIKGTNIYEKSKALEPKLI